MQADRADGCGARALPRPSGATVRQPLVLLVEDDPDCREIYRTVLLACGYAVIETANGTEALRLAGEHVPDVILMDMRVPGTDGWSATRALRSRVETSAIPIIALSAHVLAEHRARAAEAGCVSFLAKPLEPMEVVAEVGRVLGPPPPARQRALRA